jgi:hypothetical protein
LEFYQYADLFAVTAYKYKFAYLSWMENFPWKFLHAEVVENEEEIKKNSTQTSCYSRKLAEHKNN